MRAAILSVLAALGLLGCGQGSDEQVLFDGQAFRGSASADSDDPRRFTAEVSPVSASLEGARAAAEYEGIKYCVRQYGTSRIAWTIGPDAEAAALPLANDRLTLTGACRP